MSKIDLCALPIDDGDNTESNKSNIKETPLVDFGGILHVILRGIPATKENFDAVKDYITEKFKIKKRRSFPSVKDTKLF